LQRYLCDTELTGEVWAALQGLELGLGVRVVVGDARAAVGLGDAEVGEQERHRLGGQATTNILVDQAGTQYNDTATV
jgi:hypothetical protein